MVYPHFLEQFSPAVYLVAAPTGLIPCPTLWLVIGFTLLAGGLGSRAWSLVLAVAGAFYACSECARFGVTLDIALAAGALCLVALTGSVREPRRR